MNALYQYRPLIYRERPTLEIFLDENPVWGKLHIFYKENRPIQAPSLLEIFNEARYLATRAMREPPDKVLLDSTYDTPVGRICVAMAYVLLMVKGQKSAKVERQFSIFLISLAKRLYVRILNSGMLLLKDSDIDLSPMPESPEKITRKVSWWKEVTEGWDEKKITKIVRLWPVSERKEIKSIIIELENLDKAMLSNDELRPTDDDSKKELKNKNNESKRGKNSVSSTEALPVTAFLDYIEKYFPADRNADAKVVKELLLALYKRMSDEERERVYRLGTKPLYGPTTVHTGGGAAIINSELKEPKFH